MKIFEVLRHYSYLPFMAYSSNLYTFLSILVFIDNTLMLFILLKSANLHAPIGASE